MKFSLKDFLELDTKSLFSVNGGSGCGTSSGSSGGSGSSSNSPSGNGCYTSNSATNGGQTTQTHEIHDDKGNLISTPIKVGGRTKSRDNTTTSSSTVTGTSGGGCSASGTSSAPSYTKPSGTSGSSSTSNSGGTCSGSGGTDTNGGTKQPENMSVKSGNFGQITDGSYADNLTMQCYKNEPYKYQPGIDEKMNDTKDSDGNVISENSFSKSGCKMAGAAKIASEVTGKNVSLLDVNNKFDLNKDGLLTQEEIESGLESLLGEEYDVKSDFWRGQLSPEKLNEISSADDANTTYVLGFSEDCYGGHWVVLEGWSINNNGQVQFNYDGTSDNDIGRTYVLGDSGSSKKIYGIKEIQTFSVTRK